MRRFAISDIHGCCATFKALVLDKIQLQQHDELFLLGDYIDRGPNSKGVFDFIFELREEGFKVHCLAGNHESMLLQAMQNPKRLNSWLLNGGIATLNSFNADTINDIPNRYIHFMQHLPLHHQTGNYLLVHAGFNFKRDNIFADTHAMLWIRNWYQNIDHDILAGRTIVHGHTPTPKGMIEYSLDYGLPIDIDAGCAYHPIEGMGHLCALDLDSRRVLFQENVDV